MQLLAHILWSILIIIKCHFFFLNKIVLIIYAIYICILYPGVLVIWGGSLFIFRELRSPGNYLRGACEQAAKKQNKGKKNFFCLVNSKCIYFRANMLIEIDLTANMAIKFSCC